MKKKLFLALILIGSVAMTSWLLSSISRAQASCYHIDKKFGYLLICEGEVSACKFIAPDGEETICSGNKGDAIPLLDPDQ